MSRPRLALALVTIAVCVPLAAGCGESDEVLSGTGTIEVDTGEGHGEDGGGEETAATGEETGGGEETVAAGADGESVFSSNCASCHGQEGTGGNVGPDLQQSSTAEDQSAVEEVVRNGQGTMPPFEGSLSDEEITAVAEYVSGELAPMQ